MSGFCVLLFHQWHRSKVHSGQHPSPPMGQSSLAQQEPPQAGSVEALPRGAKRLICFSSFSEPQTGHAGCSVSRTSNSFSAPQAVQKNVNKGMQTPPSAVLTRRRQHLCLKL